MKKTIEEKLHVIGGVVPVGDEFVPVDEQELSSLEAKLGVRLPEDYREFLRSYGAAMFGEYVEFQPVRALPAPISSSGKGSFSSFYGAKRDPYQRLEEEIESYRGRMPDTVIPIGDDSGNQLCLGIKGNERGKVYYWDHNNEWSVEYYLKDYGTPMPPEVKFQNLHLIADSFEEFIQRLEVAEE